MKKINFSDLNGWLKTAIVVSFIDLGYASLVFIIETIKLLMGA
jgi:hypothetical protein